MGKYSKEDYEFERSKQEILALTQRQVPKEEHSTLWAFEIEEHRKRKKKEKFMMFGAVCGILSIIYVIYDLVIQIV